MTKWVLEDNAVTLVGVRKDLEYEGFGVREEVGPNRWVFERTDPQARVIIVRDLGAFVACLGQIGDEDGISLDSSTPSEEGQEVDERAGVKACLSVLERKRKVFLNWHSTLGVPAVLKDLCAGRIANEQGIVGWVLNLETAQQQICDGMLIDERSVAEARRSCDVDLPIRRVQKETEILAFAAWVALACREASEGDERELSTKLRKAALNCASKLLRAAGWVSEGEEWGVGLPSADVLRAGLREVFGCRFSDLEWSKRRSLLSHTEFGNRVLGAWGDEGRWEGPCRVCAGRRGEWTEASRQVWRKAFERWSSVSAEIVKLAEDAGDSGLLRLVPEGENPAAPAGGRRQLLEIAAKTLRDRYRLDEWAAAVEKARAAVERSVAEVPAWCAQGEDPQPGDEVDAGALKDALSALRVAAVELREILAGRGYFAGRDDGV